MGARVDSSPCPHTQTNTSPPPETTNKPHRTKQVVKKMVYLYLCNYAHAKPDLAIMCVNTLQRDCSSDDPMVRGLALRSLCSLRLPSMVEYISEPLRRSVHDR